MSVSSTDLLSTKAAEMHSEEVEEEELGEEEEELGEEEEELGEEEEELDEEQEASATVRHTRRKRAKPEPAMSAEEAWATADAEGLKLVRAPYTVSGFIHVSRPRADVPSGRDYQVRCPDQSRRRFKPSLGYYATPEHAALVLARSLGVEGSAAALRALYGDEYPRTEAAAAAIAQIPVLDREAKTRRRSEAQVENQKRQLERRKQEEEVRRARAQAKAEVKAEAQAQSKANAEAKVQAKLVAKAEAARVRQEQELLFKAESVRVRQQLEQQRQQMGAQQAQMLRAAAERQRQRQQGGVPPPATAASGAPPAASAAAAEPPTGSIDTLIRQVLRRGGCPFRRLGLERGASQEGVRKRYLALALRLHPDKAQHPQAHEAFAALECAYSRAKDAAADAAASVVWEGAC